MLWISRSTLSMVMSMHDLGLTGFLPLIPDGESAITALCMGPAARLYGATSGTASHLFVQWTSVRSVRPFDFPIDLGVLSTEGRMQTGCRALVLGPDNCLYAGTLNADGSSGHLYKHDPAREVPGQIQEFTFYNPPFNQSSESQLEDLGAPADGEGVLALVSNHQNGLIYGLGSKGTLFSFQPGKNGFRCLGHVEGPCLSRSLFCDPAGNVFGSRGS
jgi:hypothetical protein